MYESWDDAREQVENFPGAKYMGFNSQEAAVDAFRQYLMKDGVPLGDILINASAAGAGQAHSEAPSYPPEVDLSGWAVDASCLGNPGVMEYRGVEVGTGKEIFRIGPFQDATNNIGEFLAIVHALALMYRNGEWHTIYSDSISGMAWVRRRQVKTTLQRTAANAKVFDLLVRAISWLNTHQYNTPILKWQTQLWGEIPADFGRK